MNYYNDNEPFVVEWLRNLQEAGHLPSGRVDERSILNVKPKDVEGVMQAHFFAGIGGWPLALKLAGWPEEEPVWTGSCPCQPFSVAGKRKGVKDKRHLWPDWFKLIKKCRPPVVFGEQVASKDGRDWLAGVRADLERVGYAVGGADLCSAGTGKEAEGWVLRGNGVRREKILVGAPNIRQRIFWVAYTKHSQRGAKRKEDKNTYWGDGFRGSGDIGGVGHSGHKRPRGRNIRGNGANQRSIGSAGMAVGVALPESEQVGRTRQSRELSDAFWGKFDVIPCADGKSRRVEPGTFPLAHGVSARVGKLRAYGNAINPWIAAEFIKAFLECVSS